MGAPHPARRREAGPVAVARVLPDIGAITKTFDYLVPPAMADQVAVGTIVRVNLHGRRVRAWVVALADRPETDRPLQPLAKVTGHGPAPDVIDLARWAAWRWAGRLPPLLGTASPPGAVQALPTRPPVPKSADTRPMVAAVPEPGYVGALSSEAFSGGPVVVRLAPCGDRLPFVLEAARHSDPLVLAPSHAVAARLAGRLRAGGHAVALLPDDWAVAAAGGCVAIGTRAAAWAPRPELGAVLVLDEHDEVYQEERAPTWNARDVAVERARRAGAPCVLMSPCPSLEALSAMALLVQPRTEERLGWPLVEVIDRRGDPPGLGLFSERLVAAVRAATPTEPVVCVLNRKGRARLLACATCGELARCEACDAAVEQDDGGLRCRRCGLVRPPICAVCGGAKLKTLRMGVTRAREELEALAGQPVGEVTAEDDAGTPTAGFAVLVGTEAVLHRRSRAAVVAFLDLDQELLAPRYRAAEEAMALLARAARMVGPRHGRGRILLQTRLPDHETIDAVVNADPSRLAVVESARRAALRFPPETALAAVSGEAAAGFAEALTGRQGLEVMGPAAQRWLVRAGNHRILCDALAATPRPSGRLRVEVDPLRA